MLVKEVSSRVPQEVINQVLSPYRSTCRYVKEAELILGDNLQSLRGTSLRAKLSVPSCYYADKEGTGNAHFNATEFILAFNQMGYVLIAEGVRRGIAPELSMQTLSDFSQAQIDSILINRYQDILFRKQINSSDFSGEFKIENMKAARGTTFYPISVSFNDALGGLASGRSTISVVNKLSLSEKVVVAA